LCIGVVGYGRLKIIASDNLLALHYDNQPGENPYVTEIIFNKAGCHHYHKAPIFIFLRLFTFILAVYILVLTGVPCCANDNCENSTAKREQHDTQKSKEQKEDGCCGNCSPFFCHNCVSFIVGSFQYSIHQPAVFYSRVYNIYRTPFYHQYVPSLWQPPDIA